uniref:Uncharacterized protein, isoform C n=1 Tax=Drosophila melanogaster TaxID=7227 RepID=X2JFW7_DROME|nr:uncharacterized protein Dmel_CG34331, isoform C [Drosophila melanogaster]AHN59948.1 uncharacterized protein Dmel_CG34331, isoform C [Drosophila melanogaster]|eukprot:NP_001285478.1 uncharacterized protein Dmel_CG34331, isoform C [Drosophila melanogaster]
MSAIKPALLLCLILTIGLFLGQGRANPVETNVPDIPAPDANELGIDFGEEEDATDKPLGIFTIKHPRIQEPRDAAATYRCDPRTSPPTSDGLGKKFPTLSAHCDEDVMPVPRALSNLLAPGKVGFWAHSICLQI